MECETEARGAVGSPGGLPRKLPVLLCRMFKMPESCAQSESTPWRTVDRAGIFIPKAFMKF